MLREIKIQKFCLKYKSTFTTAYKSVDETEVMLLKIVDKNGLTAYGCAAPNFKVTKEDPIKTLEILKEMINFDFFNEPLLHWYYYAKKVEKTLVNYPSAQNAVIEAILNYWSLKNNVPLAQFFGGYRNETETMITISIKGEKETMLETKERLNQGFRKIKLKCGKDVNEDIKKIKALGKILPKNGKLIIDPNQGYDRATADYFLTEISNDKIDLIEQPVEAGDLDGLKFLHQKYPEFNILADESCLSFNDALRLLSQDYVSGINVKLMKCGGAINFIKMFYLAKELRKKIMIGCMGESNLSITMGVNLALALPVDFVDLDSGHLDFLNDPIEGGIELSGGKIIKTKIKPFSSMVF